MTRVLKLTHSELLNYIKTLEKAQPDSREEHEAVNALVYHFNQALPCLMKFEDNPKERTRYLAGYIIAKCIMRNNPEDKEKALEKVEKIYNTLENTDYKKRIIFYVGSYPVPFNIIELLRMMKDDDGEVCAQAYASLATNLQLHGPPNFINCSSEEFIIIAKHFEKWLEEYKEFLKYKEDTGIIDTRTGKTIYKDANKLHKSLIQYIPLGKK